jgi:hypothetical protein
VLRQVAAHMPDLYAYIAMVYGPHSTPALQFGMDGFAKYTLLPSRQGVQQGDPLGPLLFSLALIPAMVSFHQRFPSLALPAYLDDMTIMSLDASAGGRAQVHTAFAHLSASLQAVGIAVNKTKSVCLLPAGAAAAPRLPVAVAERHDGIVLMGVPVGGSEYVRAQVTSSLRAASTDRLLSEIVRMEDAQVAFTLLRLCGPARATYLARNVGSDEVLEELARFDALMLCALAAIAQEPQPDDAAAATPAVAAAPPLAWQAAVAAVRAPGWDGEAPVTLTAAQQLQIQLRQGHGGLGLSSAAGRAAAAFLGRTVESMEPALKALPAGMLACLRAREGALLFTTRTFAHVGASLARIRSFGDTAAAALPALLPPAWSGMWADGTGADAAAANPAKVRAHARAAQVRTGARRALLAQILPQTASDAASPARTRARAGAADAAQYAGASPPPPPAPVRRHRQAALALYCDAWMARELQRQLELNADDDVRLEALARWRSQASQGAMACFAAPPSTDVHLAMAGAQFRETVRRHLGMDRPAPGGRCHRCKQPQSGSHVRRCAQGANSVRHHMVVDALMHMLQQDAHLHGVKSETTLPFRRGAQLRAGAQMDLYFAAGQVDLPVPKVQPDLRMGHAPLRGGLGVACCLDVTISDGTCATYRDRASRDVKAQLLAASARKIKTYVNTGALSPATTTLFSLALDQFGAASADTHAIVRALAVRQARRSGGSLTVASCIARWRQKLSVVLQRSISDQVIADWDATLPSDDCHTPRVDGYRGLWLLRPPAAPPPD